MFRLPYAYLVLRWQSDDPLAEQVVLVTLGVKGGSYLALKVTDVIEMIVRAMVISIIMVVQPRR